MLEFEKRAVIPLKWLILAVSAYFLVFANRVLLDVEPFMLFFLYFIFNVAQSYFFYLRPIELRQIRSFILVSYLFDLLFVSGLLYFDGQYAFGREMHGDLYVFYFLVVLRGTAVFRTALGKIMMNVALSALFVMTFWQMFAEAEYNPALQRDFALKLALVWMVMLVSWFIIDLINSQAEQLVQARERLLRSEHLAAVGELAAGVAHEINNPIGIISANCDYLLRSASGDERREEFEAMRDEAQRVKGIVSQLLDYSKPHSGKAVPCDLKALNEEILTLLVTDKKPSGVKFDIDYASDLPKIWADAGQIKQALLNLYLNAREAAGAEGCVEARFAPAPDGARVAISIADDGPGMSDEDLARAFEPYFTNRSGGTGLGLMVTRRIIEAHGGEINLERRSTQGTIARIILPVGKG